MTSEQDLHFWLIDTVKRNSHQRSICTQIEGNKSEGPVQIFVGERVDIDYGDKWFKVGTVNPIFFNRISATLAIWTTFNEKRMSPIVRWTNVVASREDKQGEIKLTDFNDIPIRSGMTLSVTRHNETKVLIDLREE